VTKTSDEEETGVTILPYGAPEIGLKTEPRPDRNSGAILTNKAQALSDGRQKAAAKAPHNSFCYVSAAILHYNCGGFGRDRTMRCGSPFCHDWHALC